MKSVKASAPGSLFFAGEHAVVYNLPAIVTAVGKRTYVTATQRLDNKIIIISDSFENAEAQIVGQSLINRKFEKIALEPLLDLCEKCVQEFKLTQGFELNIESEIMPESGMSSSTAVLCAILKALDGLHNWNIREENYFDFLLPFQVKIHGGKASGAELASSSIGGFNLVQKIQIGNTTKLNRTNLGKKEFCIVIGNTKIRSATALAVQHVANLKQRKPKSVEEAFGKIEKIVKEMEKAIAKGNEIKVGELMNENQKWLTVLGVSHPKLDECIQTALAYGALGAKLSGGGWGGCMFALVRKQDQNKIANALKELNCESIVTEIGVEGVRIEK
ncbi:MAG: mevalonate kinase [Candidatus Diapherotrites archaeon]|nr:mevalonate kinase [Candidatus Diapherotrites archaeon]